MIVVARMSESVVPSTRAGWDPSRTVHEVGSATARLTATVSRLTPGELAVPTLLPGWTRGHLLTHVARNSDGLRNLLLAARSGTPVRMYASPATREADIAAGAARPADVILADVQASCERFVVDAGCMPAEAWQARIVLTNGGPDAIPMQGAEVAARRLREVEIHHVDLDAGYTFADTPEGLLDHLLADTRTKLEAQGFEVAAGDQDRWIVGRAHARIPVTASRPAMLAWLTGRSAGVGVSSVSTLPELPAI